MLFERYHVKCLLGLTATATLTTIKSISHHLNIQDFNSALIKGSTVPDNLILSGSRDYNKDEVFPFIIILFNILGVPKGVLGSRNMVVSLLLQCWVKWIAFTFNEGKKQLVFRVWKRSLQWSGLWTVSLEISGTSLSANSWKMMNMIERSKSVAVIEGWSERKIAFSCMSCMNSGYHSCFINHWCFILSLTMVSLLGLVEPAERRALFSVPIDHHLLHETAADRTTRHSFEDVFSKRIRDQHQAKEEGSSNFCRCWDLSRWIICCSA